METNEQNLRLSLRYEGSASSLIQPELYTGDRTGTHQNASVSASQTCYVSIEMQNEAITYSEESMIGYEAGVNAQ